MSEQDFSALCKAYVAAYANERRGSIEAHNELTAGDVYIVWQCKTLE